LTRCVEIFIGRKFRAREFFVRARAIRADVPALH
jgi:hypothetical protein